MLQEYIKELERKEKEEKERVKEEARRAERKNRESFKQLLALHRCGCVCLCTRACVLEVHVCLRALACPVVQPLRAQRLTQATSSLFHLTQRDGAHHDKDALEGVRASGQG